MTNRRRPSVHPAVIALLALALTMFASSTTAQSVAITPVDADVTQKFEALSYNVLSPRAATLRLSDPDPARVLIDRQVDNEADFQARLADGPDSVLLVTSVDDLVGRHAGFQALAKSRDVNIMVAAYGKLDELETVAVGTLGVYIADRIAPAGESEGMMIVQYLRLWNFAYLLGDSTYVTGPGAFPGGGFAKGALESFNAERPALRGGPWWLELLRAALEEPFWNKMHYLSGHTLGCLGVNWWTAFKILWKWEVFEQQWGFGEDMWGVIWDLIWGMVGYIDGATGWWD